MTTAAAGAELLVDTRHSNPEIEAFVQGLHVEVKTLPDAVVGDVRPMLRAVMAGVCLLLLIVCLNLGNLLLARVASRSRELAVRRALGARSSDIALQLLTEIALLGVSGGALGTAVAITLVRGIVTMAPSELPRLDALSLGAAPTIWSIAATIAALAALSVLSLMRVTGNDLSALRSDTRSGGETRAGRRFRQALVATQVAVSVVVLSGSGLLVHSLVELRRIHLGFKPDNLSFLDISIPWERVSYSQKRVNELYDVLDRELRRVPGVVDVTPSMAAPFTQPDVFMLAVTTEPGTTSSGHDRPLLPVTIGGPTMVRTLGLTLLHGRAFEPGEGGDDQPRIAVLTEGAARLLWPGENAVGKRFRSVGDTSALAWRAVVGVTTDVAGTHSNSH